VSSQVYLNPYPKDAVLFQGLTPLFDKEQFQQYNIIIVEFPLQPDQQ